VVSNELGKSAGMATAEARTAINEWDWDPFILGLLAANTLGVWYLLMKRRD
jgi:hypothetical protein